MQGDDGSFYGVANDGVYQVSPLGLMTKVIRFSEQGLTFDSGSPNNDNHSALVNIYPESGI